MPKTLNRPGRKPNDGPVPDQGCEYAPRCVACPWRECILELPAKHRAAITAALTVIARHVRQPERVTST